MNCPHCDSSKHKVIDTRDAGEAIRRRRRCEACKFRFTTYENIAASLLVMKSDGRREPFDRQKLLSGIQTAATKRPISRETIETIVTNIEEALQGVGRNGALMVKLDCKISRRSSAQFGEVPRKTVKSTDTEFVYLTEQI